MNLAIGGLSASYGAARVIDNVSFDAGGGQMIGIVGPNGVGKSTLVKVMLGLVPAARGQASLDGMPLSRQHKRVAYVPQRAELDWDYPTTTAEMVVMGSTPWHGMGWLMRPVQRAAAALDRVGLRAQAALPIAELSGGQRQRALLARALHRDADVIVLDEPFAAVDMASEAVIWRELTRLRDAGKLLLVVHHDVVSARERFDACLLLAPGSALFGPPGTVLAPAALERAYAVHPYPGPVPPSQTPPSAPRAADDVRAAG
jgi:manganese/zinc/iron transport system ATP- binding protein